MKVIVAGFLSCMLVVPSSAQTIFSPRDPGETPNRTYDVQHYRIEVAIHEDTKSVDGKVTTTLVPLFPALNAVTFQAGDMQIKRVTDIKGKDLKFNSTPNTVSVELDRPYSYKDTVSLSIEYSCTPKRGLTFNGPDAGFPNKRPQIWSQGEDTTNHFWFPCYDYPNDKATSEVIATVNSKFSLLSNGKLLNTKEDKKNKTKTFHWKQSKPHSSYLIMIAAGEYTILRDNLGRLPFEYYVYPDDTTNAGITFHQTPSMIAFFNRTIGFSYPWEKYAQIILQDHFGGMENTSATTLSDVWSVPDLRARPEVQPSSLLAHELAHQWWGDVVTCKDFRHIWLNESFASYYDPLYHEFTLGRDEFDYTMFQNQQAGIVVDTTRGRKPIVSVNSYGENVYPRGAAVLHMLRFLLGDDLYHRAIRHYITKHQFKPVETNDLKLAIEEATGQNLQWFFDQWVYKAGHPVFDLSYTWDPSTKSVSLSVSQTQKMDSLTGVFRMPVDVEVTSSSAVDVHRLEILTKDTTFVFPCAEKPRLIVFDKGNWLLKELKWQKTEDEWRYQAVSARNPVDRLRAVQNLAKLPPSVGVAAIMSDRMLFDSFWAVRREAALRAGTMASKSDTVKPVLKSSFIAALKDFRPQVRNAAVGALAWFRGNDVVDAIKASLNDSSYNVIGSALRSIAKADSANALPVMKRYLSYPSHQNSVLNASLNVLSTLDSAESVVAALERVRYGNLNGTRFTALGILGRRARGRADAMEAVKGMLDDKQDFVKSAAARTLGDIGDESAIPALEVLTKDSGGGFYLLANPVADAAKASIEKIKKRTEKKQ